MSGYLIFLKKEFMESARNYKLFIMLSVFCIFGILGPLTAKFTPELISALSPDFQMLLNEPTAVDSWVQFYKNITSLGFIIMVILFSNCLSNEYTRGTLTIMLTKGLPRHSIVLAKLTSSVAIMTASYWMCFGITCGYTEFFWRGANLPHTLFAAFALWIAGIMYLCVMMLGCVIFRQAFAGVIMLIGVIIAFTLLGMPEKIAAYNPNVLTGKNVALLSGAAEAAEFIVPMAVSLGVSAAAVVSSVLIFRKKPI